jgi:hypothetical protein
VDLAAAAQRKPLGHMDAYVPAFFERQLASTTSSSEAQWRRQVGLALAQLVASCMAHAPASKEVAEFSILAGFIPESLSGMASSVGGGGGAGAGAGADDDGGCSSRDGMVSEPLGPLVLPREGGGEEPQEAGEQLEAAGAEAEAEAAEADVEAEATEAGTPPELQAQQSEADSVKLRQPVRGVDSRQGMVGTPGPARPWSQDSGAVAGSGRSSPLLRRAASSLGKGSGGSRGQQPPKMQPELLLPGQMMHPLCQTVLQELLQLPGGAVLLQLVGSGAVAAHLREGDLGMPLTEEHAPQAHLLLLEAADILGLHPLPALYLKEDVLPFVHLLHLPAAWKGRPSSGDSAGLAAVGADGGRGGSNSRGGRAAGRGQQRQQRGSNGSSMGSSMGSTGQQSMHQPHTWRRKGMLVLSTALLQQLQQEPQQLQLVLAAAMGPLCTWGGMGWDPSAPKPPPGPGGPGSETALADALTAAALVQLAPEALLAVLPAQVVAMLPGLAPSLQVVAHMALLCGDRAVQLVAQTEQRAQQLQLQLHVMATAAGVFGCGGPAAGGSSGVHGAELQQWLEELLSSSGGSYKQLDAAMEQLAQEVTGSVYDGPIAAGGAGGVGSDGSNACSSIAKLRVLEARRWLLNLEGYPAIMATARPLRRLMPPAMQRQVAPSGSK